MFGDTIYISTDRVRGAVIFIACKEVLRRINSKPHTKILKNFFQKRVISPKSMPIM